jgi:hypothetical protein
MRFRRFDVPEPQTNGWWIECNGITYRVALPWTGPALFAAYQEDGEEHPFSLIPYEDVRFAWAVCHICGGWVRPESGRIRQARTWRRQATILVNGEVQRIDLDELERRIRTHLARESLPIWCPVANLKEHPYPSEALQTFRGSKHFAPRAKVYCFPPPWGDERKFPVIGHHRASHRLVIMVVPFHWLTAWRVELVYSPTLIRLMWGIWDGTPEGKEAAQGFVTMMEHEPAYLAALYERLSLNPAERLERYKDEE